jgi:hypothetical protein
LVAIRVPSRHEEAVRDLCRARADMVEDLDRARQRLGAFLLRHGEVWRGGSAWTLKHEAWLRARSFDDAAMAATFAHYRSVVEARAMSWPRPTPIWPGGMTVTPSPMRCTGWAPTEASPDWGP